MERCDPLTLLKQRGLRATPQRVALLSWILLSPGPFTAGDLEAACPSLGADAATVFRDVVLPLVRPAFISSLSYTFVRSMTAVSAVIFLISARWYHLTVLIYNFSENLRFGLASVLATALILIVLATFGLLRLLVPRNVHLTKTLGR